MTTNIQDLFPQALKGGELSDDAILQLTRSLRIEAIRELHKNGALSGENADRNFFTNLVAGLDTQAIQNKKIASEQKASSNNALLIAEIISKISPSDFGPKDGQVVDINSRVLPSSIPDAQLVPGEVDIDPPQLNYDSFVAANEKPVTPSTDD